MKNSQKIPAALLRRYAVHLLVTLCLMAAAAVIPFDSYYHRDFEADQLKIRPEAEAAAWFTEDEEPVFIAGQGEAFEGIAAETDGITLQDGTYTLQIVSLSEGEWNYVEVYSTRKLNEDNTQGELLAREFLAQDGELTELSFPVTESMEDISVRIGYGGEGLLNVSRFNLASQKRVYTDIFWLMGAVFVCSAFLFVQKLRGRRQEGEDRAALILLAAAVVFVSLPLSYDFVLDGNDLYYQFNRVLGVQEGLKSGQFPVKIHSTMLHGYGYGSSIFYPELFLYIPAILGCMGVSLLNCYKILIVGMNAATAYVSYRSFSGIVKSKRIGLLAALFYTLSVYRLIDLYTRAAVGEAMAMIFLPLVMWGLYELFLGASEKWYLAALGFTGLMQSHVLSVELTAFFGCIFGVCYIGRLREKGRLRHLLTAALVTILLNLGVLIPIVHHAAYPIKVFSVESTLSWWTVTLPKLFDFVLANPAKRTYAKIQNSGEMPCSLGFVLLVGLLAFLYCWYREEKRDAVLKNCMFAFGLAGLGVYLSTDFFPWDRVQGLPLFYRLVTSIQIPWRFLALSSALLCLVCAVGFFRLSEKGECRRVICGGACALAFLCAGIYVNRYCEEAVPKYTVENQYQREQSQVDVMYFADVPHANSYRIWNRENCFVPSEGVVLTGCKREENLTAQFTYAASDGGGTERERWVDVSFTWYPNYRAYDEDGNRLTTGIGDQGVLRVYLPETAEGTVNIRYREPFVYWAGRLVSLLSFLMLVFLIKKPGKRKTGPAGIS